VRTATDNLWLDAPYVAGPSLSGVHEADVVVIGGGFTGLAAAYFIKQRFPGRRVIVLEGEFVGYGSSGRNAGMGTTLLGHNILPVKKAQGTERTAHLHRLALQSISLLDELIEEHGINCDYEKKGLLVMAESEKEIGLLEKKARAYDEIGARMTWLDRDEARARFGGPDVKAALYSSDDRALNPAKFVRGMKTVVERLGVEVYEHTRCTHIEPGALIALNTSESRVTARDIVIATNAYGNPLSLFRYRVLPFHVYNIVTEPLSQSQLDNFGWSGRENVLGMKYLFWVIRLTADNRVLFNDSDALYFYDIDHDYSYRPKEHRRHYNLLVRKFPFLKGIKVSHQWGGRIGMTLDFLPSVGCRGRHQNIYYSVGYNGHGLAFAQLAGRMLAELMAGKKSELTDHMLINRSIWGVPSASISYLASNSYKTYFKIYDRLMDF